MTILYFPVVSMRSHETNMFDLSCDGNVNRWLSYFNSNVGSNNDEIHVMLPNKDDIVESSYKQLLSWTANVAGKIFYYHFIENNHPASAADLRNNAYDSDLNMLREHMKDAGLIIYERQAVGSVVEALKRSVGPIETMYWCPVSATVNVEPDFVKSYHDLDLDLAKSATSMLVATQSQADYFKKNANTNPSVFNKFVDFNVIGYPEVDRSIVNNIKDLANGRKIVYFPFRLSDKGYHFQEVLDLCKEVGNVLLVVSDPNDTLKDFDTSNGAEGFSIMTVPSDRNTYYSLLASHIALCPYLEDVTDIWHASANEYEALVDLTPSTIIDFENMLRG